MTGRWLVRRLLRLVLLLFGVSVLCFALVALSPTDPAVYVLRRGNLAVTPEALAEVRAELGLDLPLALRYLHWLGGVLTGDLGTSIVSGNAVAADLAAAFPTTLSLAALAFAEAIVLTLLAGFVAARWKDAWPDRLLQLLALVGLCLPAFWLGFLLLLAFAVALPIFSVTPQPGISGLLLPSLALSLPLCAGLVRVFRASLLEEMSRDYARYAAAMGMPRGRILLLHDLCFSLMPGERLTVIGPSGSGKTLTCRAILGQLSPQTFAASGALSFGGYDLLALERHIRCSLYGSRIAFVPQNPMTAWAPQQCVGAQMVRLLRLVRSEQKAEAWAGCVKACEAAGLTEVNEVLVKRPNELSGGMLQRTLIAMALAVGAELVIADEPTAALDVLHRRTAADALRSFSAHGCALFVVTHDLDLLKTLGGTALVLDGGQITYCGAAQEVLAWTDGGEGGAIRG